MLKDAEKEGVHMVVPWMSWIRMEVFYGCEKGWVLIAIHSLLGFAIL